jgi:hypothetical protein
MAMGFRAFRGGTLVTGRKDRGGGMIARSRDIL